MSTRSRIALALPDGFRSIYCHWDGYPSGVGAVLLSHYDCAKVEQLLALGDVSSLAESIGQPHSFADRPPGQTTFYARDRGDERVNAVDTPTFRDLAAHARLTNVEHLYILFDERWLYTPIFHRGKHPTLATCIPLPAAVALATAQGDVA